MSIYDGPITGVENRANGMLLICCSDRDKARINRYTRTRAVVAFNRERCADVLNADRPRLDRKWMSGIVNYAEVRDAVEGHQTPIVIVAARHHESARRTEQYLGAIIEHDLPALADGCRESPAAGVVFRSPQVLPENGSTHYDDGCRCDSQQRDIGASGRGFDLAWSKRNDLRLAEPRLHPGQGTFDVDRCRNRIAGTYVPNDGFQQMHDLDAMGISSHPPFRDLGFAGTSFTGDVARDALPVVRTELGGAPVRIRHIHLIRQTPHLNATLLGYERYE